MQDIIKHINNKGVDYPLAFTLNVIEKIQDNYNGIKQYEIYDIFNVLPNETECLSQETDGRKEVTLITCTPNSKKRIIVKSKEIV